jgi:hypothetical protein
MGRVIVNDCGINNFGRGTPMKRTTLLLLIVVCSSTLSVSHAQDSPFQCTSDDVLASVAKADELLTQVQNSASSGDIQAAFEAIRQISGELTSIQSLCQGWNFSGTGADALGPLELEAGVYVLEYSAEVEESAFILGGFVVQFENLDAEEFVFDSVLETYDEAGVHTGRKTVRLEGGRYLISVEPAGLIGWSLIMTKP